jgi:hypothetical protein
VRTRAALAVAAMALLAGALVRIPAAGGQAAVSHSLPGHEDLSFWVNRNGLSEIDVEGEVGFGDMARLLMRRRSNSEKMRALRDRFVFRARDFALLDTPDAARGEIRDGKLAWTRVPGPLVVAADRVFNLPVIVVDRDRGAARGLFLKVKEPAGAFTRTFTPVAGHPGFDVRIDARPQARLRVHLSEPARVYITASDGLGYAPRGAISRFTAESAEQYFHAQGTFEIDLPAGETLVEATRGIEYRLTRRSVNLTPGRAHELRVPLERWVDMAREHWHSSDAHIHANYTAPHHQVVTPEDVRLYTLAEDLHYANMMVANSSGAFLHDERYFEGRPHALSAPGYVIWWNEEMRNAGTYGHMCLYNLKSLVAPLYTGFRDTPHWEDYPPNFVQAEAARRQGGAVTYAHPGYGTDIDSFSARELPVDLALGVVDALDVLSNNPEEIAMENWYRLLNTGMRLAISAGTDAFTNVADHYAPGGGRVYARVDGAMTAGNWVAAYKRGRSFATNGPMISLAVDGREPGDDLRYRAGARKLRVRASVRSQVPVDRLELIVNGRVAISRPGAAAIDEQIELDRSSWIAARATGPWHRLILNDAYAFAHTSPVYVTLDDRPISSPDDARFWADWITRLIERVNTRARFATPERRQEVVTLFEKAREVYRARATPGNSASRSRGNP